MLTSDERKFTKSLRLVGHGDELKNRVIKKFDRSVLRLCSETDNGFGRSRSFHISAHDHLGELFFRLYPDRKIGENLFRSAPLATVLINSNDTKLIDHFVIVETDKSEIRGTKIPHIEQKATIYIDCEDIVSLLKEELEYAKKLIAASK